MNDASAQTLQAESAPAALEAFSLAEARYIVREQFEPKAWIYWTDFLASISVGAMCYGAVLRVPRWSLSQAALFVVSSLLFYRAALFIHEIVHFRSGTFRAFRFAWNLLCGIPFLTPSFTYYTHLDHHRRKHYGTDRDGEYLPLGSQSIWAILYYLSQSLIIPGLAIVRFTLLSPLSWLAPPVRRWVQRRASSLVMDPSYIRPAPDREMLRIWRVQEVACFLFCVAIGVMLVRGLRPGADPYGPHPLRRGVLPIGFLLQAYLTGVLIVSINAIRTLGAHRFLNDGREMTFVEQLIDSVNYPRRPLLLTGLWAPVGLRFHALHHLFPAMPYHNLAAAHHLLMKELPPDSPYRLTTGDSLVGSVRRLLQASRQSTAARRATLAAGQQ